MQTRAELRNAVKDLLADAATIAEDRVYKSRSRPVADDSIPCILVFTSDEEVEEATDQSNKKDVLRITLRLQLWTNATASEADPDDDLDDFCQAVRDVIDEERTWPGTILSPTYQSTNIRLEESDKRLLWALITYRFSYLG